VGGGARTPLLLLPTLGGRGIGYDLVRTVAQLAGRYLNPLARLAWRRATLILLQNRETLAFLPRQHRHKGVVFPNAAIELPSSVPVVSRSPDDSAKALFAGRLLPWKGVALAIRAMSLLPGWRLSIIGSGPDESRLRRLVRRHGLDDRVDFLPTVPREELLTRMRQDADVFLFPSLHDDGPWVVAEAVLSGLPVVCLDVGGPPILGGIGVKPSAPARTASVLASTAQDAASNPRSIPMDFTAASRAAEVRRLLEERMTILAGGAGRISDAQRIREGLGRGPSRPETTTP
jgi:glycosyltransferase involved in cell wall biosynthesis